MASYSGGTPVTGGAQWNGNIALATRYQLLSSISGLYLDIQDINLSSINVTNMTVSTLTAQNYISTPELYVSSIIGGGLQVNNGFLQISTGDISLLGVSSLQFKGIDLGGINFSFDLGLGNAIGGFLGGIGAIVGGVTIGLGTGVGLGIQGITNGLFSLANTRDSIYLNSNVYETVNGTSQLQISTLGNAYPLYSSIFRSVSSVSANEVPGPEILLSTFFQPGTTCVRTVSDPLNPLTNDSNINTSTIQSFGQWVPFIDPTPTGEDITARNAAFSTIYVNPPLGALALDIEPTNASGGDTLIYSLTNMTSYSNNYNTTSNNLVFANGPVAYNLLTNVLYGNQTAVFISSPYTQYTSTIGNYTGGVYFIQSTITSSLTTIPKFTYNGTLIGGANFAVCEPDESNFLSTATMDFVAQSSNILLQWGLAVNNRNSTIAQGTAKRISWDNTANTSNFIDIPQPLSTVMSNSITNFQLQSHPLEIQLYTVAFPNNGSGGGRAGFAFDINRATFGAGTTFLNEPGYPYQFNGNVFIDGVLEVDSLIAISSIVNVSTNIQTLFSTSVLDADQAFISTASIDTLYSSNAIVSSLTSSNSYVINSQLLSANILSATVTNLNVLNLFATNLTYGNAEAPNIETSTIQFGFAGNYTTPNTVNTLQMNVSGPSVYTSYSSASNQTINFLNMSNSVIVNAAQISTPYNFYLANFNGGNRPGWQSTIYYNPFSTPIIATFSSNAGPGTVSLQGGSNANSLWMCVLPNTPEIVVRRLSTFQFNSDGINWTTTSNPPPASGPVSFNNTANIYMDYENFTISTSDTLVLSADVLQVNAQTNIPNLQANNIFTSNLVVNPVASPGGGIETLFNKPRAIPFANAPTQVTPLQMSFTEQSPDGIPQYSLVPQFMGSNSFTSYNVSSWNNTLWNNTTAFSLGQPNIYCGDVQTYSPYFGSFFVNNTIVTSPSYAMTVYFVSTTGRFTLGSIPGGQYANISTTNGKDWTLTAGVPSPMFSGGNFSNIVTANQTISQTTVTNTQNLAIQAPNISMTTGSLNMYADQIRVNSRTFGTLETVGLPSFPIGIENNVYIDSNMSFTFLPASGLWESVAQNVLYNINNTIFYDVNSWALQIIPSRFRTNANPIYEWDVQPAVLNVTGGGYCWGYNRYILVSAPIPGGPGSGTNNWNWYMAIPKNYCTFL